MQVETPFKRTTYMLEGTKQELFDKMVRGLHVQDWERSMREGSVYHCAYLGAGGRKCAIGHLLSEVEAIQESQTVSDLCPDHPYIEFLVTCQRAHDLSVKPDEMWERFKRIAKEHSLTFPSDI
jgi:hypothetical protein